MRLPTDDADAPDLWTGRDMSGAFKELEHPADLLVQIQGDSLNRLFENSLYALYAESADLDAIPDRRSLTVEARGAGLEEALRALLAEALYLLDTEGFVATGARVTVREGHRSDSSTAAAEDEVVATAAFRGGAAPSAADRLTEIKAVTYHRLSVTQDDDGQWRATVLFDV